MCAGVCDSASSTSASTRTHRATLPNAYTRPRTVAVVVAATNTRHTRHAVRSFPERVERALLRHERLVAVRRHHRRAQQPPLRRFLRRRRRRPGNRRRLRLRGVPARLWRRRGCLLPLWAGLCLARLTVAAPQEMALLLPSAEARSAVTEHELQQLCLRAGKGKPFSDRGRRPTAPLPLPPDPRPPPYP